MRRVEKLAWNYEIEQSGISDTLLGYQDQSKKYTWDNDCPCYQRHYPEAIDYEILRPIKTT